MALGVGTSEREEWPLNYSKKESGAGDGPWMAERHKNKSGLVAKDETVQAATEGDEGEQTREKKLKAPWE